MDSSDIRPARRLEGAVQVPGDKSISHRSIILSSLCRGSTLVTNVLKSLDCLDCLNAFREMGVRGTFTTEGLVIEGNGPVLKAPSKHLWMGNSGTAARLNAGVLSGQNFTSVLYGDESLNSRPMARIAAPLRLMGASVEGSGEKCLPPLTIKGRRLKGIFHDMTVASAQVKSCLMLASLFADGVSQIREPNQSRDHTERMFSIFGLKCSKQGLTITIPCGQEPESPGHISVPGDFSSAFFLMCAAALIEGSDVTIKNVGINPTRTAGLDVLMEMGAKVEINKTSRGHDGSPEPAADIRVRGSGRLKAVTIGGPMIPNLIDELPMLCVMGAFCEGTTRVKDAEELRVKESDRIASVAHNLEKLGARCGQFADGIEIHGLTVTPDGRVFESFKDHRIAMSFAVAALKLKTQSTILDTACVETSFPGFFELLRAVCV